MSLFLFDIGEFLFNSDASLLPPRHQHFQGKLASFFSCLTKRGGGIIYNTGTLVVNSPKLNHINMSFDFNIQGKLTLTFIFIVGILSKFHL